MALNLFVVAIFENTLSVSNLSVYKEQTQTHIRNSRICFKYKQTEAKLNEICKKQNKIGTHHKATDIDQENGMKTKDDLQYVGNRINEMHKSRWIERKQSDSFFIFK